MSKLTTNVYAIFIATIVLFVGILRNRAKSPGGAGDHGNYLRHRD